VGRAECVRPDGFVPFARALLNVMMSACGDGQAEKLMEVIASAMSGIMRDFVAQGNVEGLLEFLTGIVNSRQRDSERAFYHALFDRIVVALGPLWVTPSDKTMDVMSEFICCSIDAGVVADMGRVVEWVANALSIAPAPGHFVVLARVARSDGHHVLLGNQRAIVEFVMEPRNWADGPLMVEVMRLIAVLAQKRWSRFFECFQPDFVRAALTNSDVNVVEQGLRIVNAIVLEQQMSEHLEQAVRTMTEGMLSAYVDACIDAVIDIFDKIVRASACSPEEIVRVVVGGLPVVGYDAGAFERAFLAGSDPSTIKFLAKRMVNAYRRELARGR